jgi:hypothetical protein
MGIQIQMNLLDYLPIWVIYLLTVGLSLLAVELGYRMGILRKRHHPDEDETIINTMLGATLAMWAFLLAFLVSIAANRFDERRSLVVQEANAIGTTYLRAGYLPELYRSESRKLLQGYAASRVALNQLDGFKQAVNAAPELQASLWNLAQEMAINSPSNPIYSLYISSLNETIDLHTSRVVSLTTSRIPYTIYVGMYIIGVLGLFMLGYHNGLSEKRNWVITVVLVLIFSTIMLLIIDLDRPWGGFLTVSQQPMVDLINSFKSFK